MNGGGVTPSPTPTPIPVDGVVQVFKDNACTEYADGQSNVVYVRVNENFGDGDQRSWGELSGPNGQRLTIYTPTEIDPQEQYLINVWADFNSTGKATPFTEGEVVECEVEEQYFHPVSNPQVIFE